MLAAWSKMSESGSPQTRSMVQAWMRDWQADADLAGLRDEAALAKLPEADQRACRALWAEAEALRRRAGIDPRPCFGAQGPAGAFLDRHRPGDEAAGAARGAVAG